jgi:F-type H+-transporting ATPase subunit delta
MDTDVSLIINSIIGQIYLTEQLDALHLDLVALKDMAEDGTFEDILEKPSRTSKQQLLLLEKIIKKLISPELRSSLCLVLHEQNLEFFSQKVFPLFLHQTRVEAEKCTVVKIILAIIFKPEDLQEMALILSEKVGTKVIFEVTVDKTLIGGTVIQLGDYLSDYSIRTRLTQFREQWSKAVIEG